MNLTVTRQNLQTALAAVAASIPSKTTLPVLSNVLLEADGEHLSISGTDLDVSIRIRVPAEIASGGAITAPGRMLQEIARELPDEPVGLAIKGRTLEINCGYSHFTLHALASEEFPNFPDVGFDDAWTVAATSLRTLIQRSAFAVSTEDSRPILKGVYWELGEDRMTMVSTNGHRLARMSTDPSSAGGQTTSVIVPPAALIQVEKIFDGDDEIAVARAGNYLGFRSPTREIYTRLIDGKYPNYEQVIPRDNDKVAVVARDALEAAVRRIAVVARRQTHRIKFSFAQNRVVLDANTPDLGNATDEVQIDYDREEIQIGFNGSYLVEILRNMPQGDIRISFKTAERATTLEPADPDEQYLCLIMPLRIMD